MEFFNAYTLNNSSYRKAATQRIPRSLRQ